MRILLTNDDGIYARGLGALYDELSAGFDCLIVAPEVEQSAVGHAITVFRPLMVRPARKNGRFLGYAVAGTPADCVKIGVRELSDKPVDLVVSGINLGANVGTNVIYSGTVSAATEAVIMGIPSLAVSLNTHREADFSFAARFTRRMVEFIGENPLEENSVINVNVPALPEEEIRGVLVTNQGKSHFKEKFAKRVSPRDNVYYWLDGETVIADPRDTTSDVQALKRGFVSITPLKYDLTSYRLLAGLKERIGRHFGSSFVSGGDDADKS